jgi:hypothetical protein
MNTDRSKIYTLHPPSTRRVRIFTWIALAAFLANFWSLNFQDNGIIKFLLFAIFLTCAFVLFNTIKTYRKSCLSVEFAKDHTKMRFVSGENLISNEMLGYSVSPDGNRIAISQMQMIGYKHRAILDQSEIENFSSLIKDLEISNLKLLTWIEPISSGKFMLNLIEAFSSS